MGNRDAVAISGGLTNQHESTRRLGVPMSDRESKGPLS